MGRKVSGAKIEIEADIDPLKKGVGEARKEVNTLGADGDKAGRKLSGGMAKAGKGADNLAASLGKVTGIIGAVVAAVAAVGAAWKAVNDYIRDGKKLANEFLKELDTVADASGSLEQINKRMIQVGAELEKKNAGGIGALTGRKRAQIEAEYEALGKRQLAISRQVRQQMRNEERKEREAGLADLKQQLATINEDAAMALLPDADQLEIMAAVQASALKKAAIKAGIEADDEAFVRAIKNIEERAGKEAEKMREIEAEKSRLEAQRIEENAQKQIEAAVKAAEAFGEAAASSLFGSTSDFTTRLDTILGEIQSIGRNQGRR